MRNTSLPCLSKKTRLGAYWMPSSRAQSPAPSWRPSGVAAGPWNAGPPVPRRGLLSAYASFAARQGIAMQFVACDATALFEQHQQRPPVVAAVSQFQRTCEAYRAGCSVSRSRAFGDAEAKKSAKLPLSLTPAGHEIECHRELVRREIAIDQQHHTTAFVEKQQSACIAPAVQRQRPFGRQRALADPSPRGHPTC